MSKTIVLQSDVLPIRHEWLLRCIESVKAWAAEKNFYYEFIDDALFDYVSNEVLQKTKKQKVIATDLARLKILQKYLKKGYETVIWCDSDFIIFNPQKFELINESYALGREVWVQEDLKRQGKLNVHIKVHNAFMMYRVGNVFLDFYADTSERLLLKNLGTMPAQFIGPKLLTALHNVAQCPVMESAGMLSPLVVKDIAMGGGEAAKLFISKSSQPIYAANVCNSLYEKGEYSTDAINKSISTLIADQGIRF